MKKVYEAPKVLVEVVCVDEMLAESISIKGGDTKITKDNESALLGKDRGNDSWGDLW